MNVDLPKEWLQNLFKPFVIRKLIERGIVKTVKSAKKLVDRKDPVIWEILENILKGHPDYAQPGTYTAPACRSRLFSLRLIEGKAIQLHPLVCGAFNADFDGDQMAVHVPLESCCNFGSSVADACLRIICLILKMDLQLPCLHRIWYWDFIISQRKEGHEGRVKVTGEGMNFYSALKK